jgi:hypothetical protein
MDKVIVYVDDATYAQQVLAPLLARDAAAHTHWVLVACAPRMTHRISKWVSHSARENWRGKWADKLFAQMLPALALPASQTTTVLARGPLEELTAQLQLGHVQLQTQVSGTARSMAVVDARRPKASETGVATREAGAVHRDGGNRRWLPEAGTLGSLLTGFGALWALALE